MRLGNIGEIFQVLLDEGRVFRGSLFRLVLRDGVAVFFVQSAHDQRGTALHGPGSGAAQLLVGTSRIAGSPEGLGILLLLGHLLALTLALLLLGLCLHLGHRLAHRILGLLQGPHGRLRLGIGAAPVGLYRLDRGVFQRIGSLLHGLLGVTRHTGRRILCGLGNLVLGAL